MKYSEAKKAIEALSSKYEIYVVGGEFNVHYKNKLVALVKNNEKYLFYSNKRIFKNLPFSNKLYMILSEISITPLDERAEAKKYYVKVFDGDFGYLNVRISTGNITVGSVIETEFFKTKFTDKAIEQLKQREDIPLDWNKVTLEEAK